MRPPKWLPAGQAKRRKEGTSIELSIYFRIRFFRRHRNIVTCIVSDKPEADKGSYRRGRRITVKEDIKSLLKFFAGFLAFLFIYGTAGSLELDKITVRQALIRIGVVFGAVAIGAAVSAIKQHREEE